MELQALRYAAMVSTMRFDQAVEAHRKYLKSMGSSEDPEQVIRDFLESEDGQVALSEEVRIVLAASDFPQELTTAVLWLNKQGLDIRCVQMRPHLVDQRVLIDIQQVIPLPEAEQYQVAVREKSMEQAAARPSARDWTRFDLVIGDQIFTNLPKRRLIYEVVREALRRGLTPSQIGAAVPWKESTIFLAAEGQLDSLTFRSVCGERSLARYYSADEDLFHVNGKTYAFSTQWGSRTLEAVDNITRVIPAGASITHSPTTKVVEEVTFGEHVIRQRENGSIEVERNGESIQPVKPVLRELASALKVGLNNPRGNDLNTQQLGALVLRAIKAP